ncbi:hypothetical protein OIU76_027673 [Salix suchowensis]|nr:hypothetical protein OIU76_027673 [Salix suchowensis]
MADDGAEEVKKREIVVGLPNSRNKLFKIRKPPKPKLKAAEVEKKLSKIPKPPKPKSDGAEEVKKREIVVALPNSHNKLFKIRKPPKPKLKAAEVEKELSKIPKPPKPKSKSSRSGERETSDCSGFKKRTRPAYQNSKAKTEGSSDEPRLKLF